LRNNRKTKETTQEISNLKTIFFYRNKKKEAEIKTEKNQKKKN
jgi:hypothetical protein